MNYYVTLTTECNLTCRYCYGKLCEDFDSDFLDFEVDYTMPSEITYGIEQLKGFLVKDPDVTLVFYGGEPLLRVERVKEIMDEVPAKRYMLQTNATLLDRLEPKYANRLHTILVSIDGDEETTDRNRGRGTYRRVVENVKSLRERGFEGEVIARMTVNEDTEIEKQVKWLLFNSECSFTSVHWQLDALRGETSLSGLKGATTPRLEG
ncbi:MAG: radical SAM protein [Candidatus Bathyarchaeia archaeon]